nr:immunoglobulin light chain junction region [Macaca mulatta]MPN68636.1 immunoglobulin light chain junction region [Macaca mulatta]
CSAWESSLSTLF